MAGRGNPKTGGRPTGGLNIGSRSLGRKRERVRRDAVVAIQEAMPQLRTWLSSGETWKEDGAQAARMLDALMKWVLPSYGKIDPHAEQAAEGSQPAQTAGPPLMTTEQILAAFKTLPPRPAKPVSSVHVLAHGTEDATGMVTRGTIQAPDSGRELAPAARTSPHEGIPLPEPGMAYLPKPPPMPKRAERGAEPAIPKPAIDAEPVDPYANSRRPSGCVSIHKLPEDTPVFFSR